MSQGKHGATISEITLIVPLSLHYTRRREGKSIINRVGGTRKDRALHGKPCGVNESLRVPRELATPEKRPHM
jgi:hypothetical protein